MTSLLTVSTSVSIALPDQAEVEAKASAKIAELQASHTDAKSLVSGHMAKLNVSTPELATLVKANPKLVDGQLRGKIATASRFERELALWQGVVPAYQAVKAKLATGTPMVTTSQRPWGRTRSRIYAVITDADLLVLRRAGLLSVD